ncbi:M23 family metallopeptidase [Afifella pfennigii]|uniref:M23 family metallopeptidase n=1 Tax=Afifella pfennigii TaxID=209897 RepID=UPI000556434D|nr:M23 family metallopeptidase [Afifella pfennigii]
MRPSQAQHVPFGRRKEPPRLFIARGGKLKAYPFRPWLFGTVAGVFITFGLGYVGATGYLIYRDGLLDAAVARQVDLQYTYEDRIARLRAELDRMTSKHLVETQSIEEQVATLSDRQQAILRRQALLDQVIDSASAAGLPFPSLPVATPKPRPDGPGVAEARAASAPAEAATGHALSYAGESASQASLITGSILRRSTADAPPTDPQLEPERTSAVHGEHFRPLLRDMDTALKSTLQVQSNAAAALSAASLQETVRLEAALSKIGFAHLVPPSARDAAATGGPFIPADSDAALKGLAFVESIDAIYARLEDLRVMRSNLAALPLGSPIKARRSSGFGYRTDPFLGRPALHSGVDFSAATGTAVRSTGPGRVVKAGWNGGYGKMVEIEHAHGIVTRYAHMSRVEVKAGQRVEAGEIIGRVGSTGRSTGPHLHYETRRNGKAVNPNPFLRASRKI